MSLSTRSDAVLLDPALVPLWMSEVSMDQLFQIATTTALVYDSREFISGITFDPDRANGHIVITMDKEVSKLRSFIHQ